MTPIRIEHATAPTDAVRALIAALEAELAMLYTSEQRHGLPLAAIFQPHIKFFTAWVGAEALGCGGVAFLGDFAEVKRMFVAPPARGQGIARAILARIEAETSAMGIKKLKLETGDKQLAAIRCYEAAGFARCGAFGDYLGMTSSAIATSVFFEKLVNV